LKALKANDEEAYMKLIDMEKDTRITHLLHQTNSYLGSLAQAIMAQQSNSSRGFVFHPEDAPNKTAFGAQIAPDDKKGKIDYYAVSDSIIDSLSHTGSPRRSRSSLVC
jgi:ATP-dependent helicase STH1/SNF2